MKAPDNAGNARDASLTPWRRKQQPSRHSCLENSMDRGAWQATVHRVTKSGHDWAGTQQQPMAPALLFKIFCSFILWCQRRLLKSLLDSKEIKPVNPKGNQPWCSLKGLTLKRQYFGHLMQRAGSLEKTLTSPKIQLLLLLWSSIFRMWLKDQACQASRNHILVPGSKIEEEQEGAYDTPTTSDFLQKPFPEAVLSAVSAFCKGVWRWAVLAGTQPPWTGTRSY